MRFTKGTFVRRIDGKSTGIVLAHYKTGTVLVASVFPFTNKSYLWSDKNIEAIR